MICPKCKTEVDGQAVFCPECGASMLETAPEAADDAEDAAVQEAEPNDGDAEEASDDVKSEEVVEAVASSRWICRSPRKQSFPTTCFSKNLP